MRYFQQTIMTYLYIDESGDLGFGKHGSSYFVLTCIKIDDERVHQSFCRIPKKVRQRKLSKKHKRLAELKFSNSSDAIRNDFLRRVAALDVEIYAVVIPKEKTNNELQNNLPILYNYLIKILLEKPPTRIKSDLHLMICLDRAMSLWQRQNFEAYVKTEFLSIIRKLPKVEILHENSQQNPCLQVADFVCGAFGYKYNTAQLQAGAEKYLNIVKRRIIIERCDLFK